MIIQEKSSIIILYVEIAGRGLMYIARHAEQTVKKLSRMFGAVLVAGSRQVGRTIFLIFVFLTDFPELKKDRVIPVSYI